MDLRDGQAPQAEQARAQDDLELSPAVALQVLGQLVRAGVGWRGSAWWRASHSTGWCRGWAGPTRDTRGGFVHGGWGDGYQDHVSAEFMAEGMTGEGAMLFGRRSYHDLLQHWTTATEPNPFTGYLTAATKYVVSRSADTRLPYPNSVLLVGEAVDTVAALTKEVDGDLTVISSGDLVRALHAAGLVDSYVLQIHPITLGSGTRLFGASDRRDLVLERSVTTTTGVIIAQYAVRALA